MRPVAGWRWPLPALLAWLLAWYVFALLRGPAATPLRSALAVSAALLLGVAAAWALHTASRWRRLIVAGGFPLSLLASDLAAGLPAWAWLAPLGLLALAYPMRAWHDAPLFPTPAAGLAGLADRVALPEAARVLDAGCGLGHGLQALRREWPAARLEGIEWSWPLRLVAALRCPWARVRQGDLWADDWSGLALVYLFQRPESMARALAKARAEMAPGSWLVSLEFAVPQVEPDAVLQRPGAKPVWLYRMGLASGVADTVAQSGAPLADNPGNRADRSVGR